MKCWQFVAVALLFSMSPAVLVAGGKDSRHTITAEVTT